MRRLFIGQGSLHCLTAVVAGESCTEGGEVPGPEDILLFHGLNPDPAQSEAWAGVLRRAVQRLGRWDEVVHLLPQQIATARAAASLYGWRSVRGLVHSWVGAESIEEIYVQRNPEFINHLLVAAYPAARVICYGDGLGLNYSDHYWLPAASPSIPRSPGPRRGMAGLRAWARRLGGRDPEPPRPRFDRHCLLLPNCFDDRVEHPVVPDPDRLREKIDALLPALAEDPPGGGAADPLADALGGAEEIAVLLTSCFSEAERIEPGDEVAGYVEAVGDLQLAPGAVLVVKPHPRDLDVKIEALLAELRRRHRSVVLLDDPDRRYLPFEVTLRLALSRPDLPPRRFLAFSSAALALELLYGEETILGFGEERVRRLFRPEYVSRRLRHERDLHRALERVRLDRAAAAPAPTREIRS